MVVSKFALQLFFAALFAGSSWMAVQGYRSLPAGAAAPVETPGDPPECRVLLADDVSARDYEDEIRRDHPPSRYVQFPAAVRPLLRRADIERIQCDGRLPANRRACNRWTCIALELERRGWCWGGGESSSEDRWIRCAQIPEDPPLSRRLPFTEEDIRNAFPPRATRLDVSFTYAKALYSYDPVQALPDDHPLARMRREGEARLATCATPACRERVEADLLNRLAFGRDFEVHEGEEVRPVPGIPLRMGVFRIGRVPATGGVDLLPVGGNDILLRSDPSLFEPEPRGCRSVIAHGQLGPDGVARMTTLDDLGLRFTLHVLSPTRIALRPIGGSSQRHPPLCAPNGKIFGEYETPALRP